jgi:hypothetical protein
MFGTMRMLISFSSGIADIAVFSIIGSIQRLYSYFVITFFIYSLIEFGFVFFISIYFAFKVGFVFF